MSRFRHVRRVVGSAVPMLLVAMAITSATVSVTGAASGQTPGATGVHCADPTGSEDFQRLDPTEAKVDPGLLTDLIEWASSRNSSSVRVYRRGCLLGASRMDALSQDLPVQWQSVSKSITALTVGRAEALGFLSLDDPVSKYFPEADAAHGRILLRHLITQSGGLRFSLAGDGWNTQMTDGVRIALHQEVVHQPGTYFEYQQHGITLLLACVQRAVGEDVQDFMQRELFGKIGISRDQWWWNRDRAGWTTGWWGLYLSPRLMPRFGQLMLDGGLWNGDRILSERFVHAAGTSNLVNGGYGYLMWTNHGDKYWTPTIPVRRLIDRSFLPSAPRDTFMFNGFGGQYVYVIPSLDIVIERSGSNPYRDSDPQTAAGGAFSGDFDWELFQRLNRAVTDVHWGDPGPYVSPPGRAPVDTEKALYPEQDLAGLGVGQRAGGCNIVGCDGSIDFSGYDKQRTETARYVQELATRGAVRP
jgi:CubicO group peptidase (beta-lactamase class C family)